MFYCIYIKPVLYYSCNLHVSVQFIIQHTNVWHRSLTSSGIYNTNIIYFLHSRLIVLVTSVLKIVSVLDTHNFTLKSLVLSVKHMSYTNTARGPWKFRFLFIIRMTTTLNLRYIMNALPRRCYIMVSFTPMCTTEN